ncbi:hypothetical protein CPC08DRAFT_726593 [Agrocybe pediades]|nr:hypothetical protein CPC08DRAFT_726593 [Agrocybe pediades]
MPSLSCSSLSSLPSSPCYASSVVVVAIDGVAWNPSVSLLRQPAAPGGEGGDGGEGRRRRKGGGGRGDGVPSLVHSSAFDSPASWVLMCWLMVDLWHGRPHLSFVVVDRR